MNRRSLAFLLLSCALGYWMCSTRSVDHPPGVIAPDPPVQTALESPLEPWEHEGYRITALAGFELRARLLGTERYRFDSGAALSPVDFALGWGGMSDTAVLDKLSISQGGRFYAYRWSNQPPLPSSQIIRSSANMHLIPATDEVKQTLLSARVGQLVTLSGKLVRADGEGGWKWKSSLTRSDSGGGACELIWVEDVALADE